jgi:hypothetical protein
MNKPDIKQESVTVINGIVLTDKVMDFLRTMQEENNSQIKETREMLGDSISLLIEMVEGENNEITSRILDSIKYLNGLRKSMLDLMKP